MTQSDKKIVLFRRDFQRFTGGHLKVWHYFNHVLASEAYAPRIAFTPDSKWDATNPWNGAKQYICDWNPNAADALFLAGKDWEAVSNLNAKQPVVNLIQHPRHANPDDKVSGFLRNRAIRICVSQQVADAINGTGKVNGPVFVIPNALDTSGFPMIPDQTERPIQVLLCGLKAPDLAREIDRRLQADENVAVTPLLDWVPRSEFLMRASQARIVVTLPRSLEGFYLPALEAMACGAIVICPDCVGNRDFCHDGANCFRPAYQADAIVGAIYRALALSPPDAEKMRDNARSTVAEHSLERERSSFFKMLGRLDEVWQS